MRVTILITVQNYGGFVVHNWQLSVTFEDGSKKVFYLGQDAKVCSRILGMRASEVALEIGTNDLSTDEAREKLANFIIDTLDLNEESLRELQTWEIAAE